MRSYEEYLEAHNRDLADKSVSELQYEMWRAARLAQQYPDAMLWLGIDEYLTVRQWADERITVCRALLAPPSLPPVWPKRKVRSWT